MTTLSSKSGSIYDTLYVSKVKKNTSVNVLRPQNVAFNMYDASQKKSGQFGNDRLAYMPQQCDKIESHQD
jgi:hypothetical protein